MMLSRPMLVSLARAGVGQRKILELLIDARTAILIAGTEEEDDQILDLLDSAADWCSPDLKLPYRRQA